MICPICGASNSETLRACHSCGSPLLIASTEPVGYVLPPGTKLSGGAYTLGRVLGQGGFGITYLGSEVKRNRAVAIKEFFPAGCRRHGQTLQTAGAMSPDDFQVARERFSEEAKILTKFHHPGIVQVHSVFEENETVYMVMEYLRGRNLETVMKEREGPLPEGEAVSIIELSGEALAVVHRAGLLHRDIKPENLIFTEDGRIVLIDFGSAREFIAGKTRRMTALVTQGFAPLEQYGQQARFGIFTDIYALGATTYYLLTKEVPVSATDRATGVELPSIRRINPTVSEGVEAAVLQALEIPIDRRPQSVPDYLEGLRKGLHERPGSSSRSQSATLTPTTAPTILPPRLNPVPIPNPTPTPPAPPHRAPRSLFHRRPSPPPPAPRQRVPRTGILPWFAHYSQTLGKFLGGVGGSAAGLIYGGSLLHIPGALLGLVLGGMGGLLLGVALGALLPYALIFAACYWPVVHSTPDKQMSGLVLFLFFLLLGLIPLAKRPK